MVQCRGACRKRFRENFTSLSLNTHECHVLNSFSLSLSRLGRDDEDIFFHPLSSSLLNNSYDYIKLCVVLVGDSDDVVGNRELMREMRGEINNFITHPEGLNSF
jgi:hypothetical protein